MLLLYTKIGKRGQHLPWIRLWLQRRKKMNRLLHGVPSSYGLHMISSGLSTCLKPEGFAKLVEDPETPYPMQEAE